MTTPPAPRVVLASASPRRRDILTGLGVSFTVVPSREPEPDRRAGEGVRRYAIRLARLKARSVARRRPSALVIGADTVVSVREHLLGKPAGASDAARMLRLLAGRWHEVVTGVALIDGRSGRETAAAAVSGVHFRRLAPRDIEWYLATGEHRDKAGAYAIQGRASVFIDRIEGCYFNIVGFPVAAFDQLCRRLGYSVDRLSPPRIKRKDAKTQRKRIL
jgi:septum formation protein